MNRLKTCCIALFFVALYGNRAHAVTDQQPGHSNPQVQVPVPHSSYSNPAIPQLRKRLDTILQENHIPGLMVVMVKQDSILFSSGLGYADREQKIKVDTTTLFHFASVTKFFVALGVQKLIMAGKLHLNDRIRDIAPEIPFTNQWEATDPVRLVHLLEHTAGFEDVPLNKMVSTTGTPLTGLASVKALSSALHARWKPGLMMSYSNPTYNVLGYIIEKTAGMPWDSYIRQSLFTPLGMESSLFDLNGQNRTGFAKGYDFKDGVYRPLPFYIPSGNGAGSALVSNASDMAKALHYLLNGHPSTDLPGPAQLLEMETIHSTLASRRGLQTGYALGNDLFPNNKKISLRGHNGKGEGFVSWIFFNRQAGLAYAIAANCNANLWPVSEAIEHVLTQDIQPPILPTVTIDPATIEPMLGYYQFMNPKNERWEFHRRIFGGIHLLSIQQGKLLIKKGDGQIDSLIPMGKGIFRQKNDILPSYILARDQDGQPFLQGPGSSFYYRTAYTPVFLQKLFIYLGLIAVCLSFLYTLIGIPLVLYRKIKMIDLSLPFLPIVGVLSFWYAFRLLGSTDAASKELFNTFNATSFSIFAGMLLFGLTVASGAYLLYRRWYALPSRWISIPLALNYLFLAYLVALFSIHGWIGVPIWIM